MSTQLLVQKQSKEIDDLLATVGIIEEDDQITYNIFCGILNQLGYLTENVNEAEKKLVVDMWKILKGDQNGSISKRNIKIMIKAITNIKTSDMILDRFEPIRMEIPSQYHKE